MTIDLGINQGTFCSPKAIEVLRTYTDQMSLRQYSESDNRELLDVIAELNDVRQENVYVDNGSGPILRTALYQLIKKRTESSVQGILKYLLFKKLSVPLVTPRFTYKKVPPNAAKVGIPVDYIPTGPEVNFQLDVRDVRAAIERHDRDCIVYIVNPNNPTGNLLLEHDEIAELVAAYPATTFWIDEVYHEYIDPERYRSVAHLVTRHDNLIVSRSMSFAYGLASLRIGYLMGAPKYIEMMEKQTVPWRIGKLQQEIAVASFKDDEFLPWMRDMNVRERGRLRRALEAYDNIEVFPSDANFLFCRFRDGRTSRPFADKFLDLGLKIKREDPHGGYRFDEYFRVSVGIPEENTRFIELLDDALAVYSDHTPLSEDERARLVG